MNDGLHNSKFACIAASGPKSKLIACVYLHHNYSSLSNTFQFPPISPSVHALHSWMWIGIEVQVSFIPPCRMDHTRLRISLKLIRSVLVANIPLALDSGLNAYRHDLILQM